MKDNKLKKYKSIFILLAGSSLKRMLLLFAGMVMAEVFLFWHTLNKMLEEEAVRMNGAVYANGNGPAFSLETAFEESYIVLAFRVFFILCTMILCVVGCDKGSKTEYTLRRLSISEKKIFVCQTIYNMATYFVFFAIQLFIALGLCSLFLAKAPEYRVSDQTVLLAFYRNSFLHSLLPLEDTFRWIRNVLLIIALGFSSAYFPYRQRRGGWSPELVMMALFCVLWFGAETGNVGTTLIIGSLVGIVRPILKVKEDE